MLMRTYLIKIKGHCPCPRERDYRLEGSSYGTVINRAIKQYRKDIGRRKISRIQANATQL